MSPTPLPEPPSDYGKLAASFPSLRKEHLPQDLWRIHRHDREAEWFSADGSGRFDPPASATPAFGTCYAASSEITAFIEVFGDFDLITDRMIEDRCVAWFTLRDDVKLADMTNRLILGDWGLDQRISLGDDYGICQRWANALHLAGFSGVYFRSRHDAAPQLLDCSVALFGDPGHQPTQLRVQRDGEPIDSWVLDAARQDFGIRVLPSAPLR